MKEPQVYLQCVIPCFEDSESLKQLLPELASALAADGLIGDVLIVDDGSMVSPVVADHPGKGIGTLRVLRLNRNMGHQRAIAIGLVHLARNGCTAPAVVVLDSDGEDRPSDVVRLYRAWEAAQGPTIIFAGRRKRSEGPVFRLAYLLYQWLFRVLTGQQVQGGNFSLVPRESLYRLTHMAEVWSHYAATLQKSRQPIISVPTDRGQRYSGKSAMGFSSLIIHGLSAISVFGETAAIRMILGTLAGIAVAITGLAVICGVRLFSDMAIPGWATSAAGIMAVILLQQMMTVAMLVIILLGHRQQLSFVPYNQVFEFVVQEETIDPHA